jgi:hypothetical protein
VDFQNQFMTTYILVFGIVFCAAVEAGAVTIVEIEIREW